MIHKLDFFFLPSIDSKVQKNKLSNNAIQVANLCHWIIQVVNKKVSILCLKFKKGALFSVVLV